MHISFIGPIELGDIYIVYWCIGLEHTCIVYSIELEDTYIVYSIELEDTYIFYWRSYAVA